MVILLVGKMFSASISMDKDLTACRQYSPYGDCFAEVQCPATPDFTAADHKVAEKPSGHSGSFLLAFVAK